MENIKKHLIYVLRDPDTLEARYVGRSSIGMGRPNYHLCHSTKKLADGSWVSELYVHRWIRSLTSAGKKPIIDVVEQFEYADDVNDLLNEAEIAWIAKLKAEGCRLTNATDGGGGILNPSEEVRRKMSESHIGIPSGRKGIPHTEETKLKISEACKGLPSQMKGKHHSEEAKEKLRQANLGTKHSDRTGGNHWTHRLGRGPNSGKELTPEWRARLSAMRKGCKLRPEEIERRCKKVVRLNDGMKFPSCKSAAIDSCIDYLSVSRCCRDGKERKGFKFSFLEAS